MSDNPDSPQGFSQYGECLEGEHLGKKISLACKKKTIDGSEVVENLFGEQSVFMNTLTRLQKAKVGGIQIKLVPVKNDNGFWGKKWSIKRVQ